MFAPEVVVTIRHPSAISASDSTTQGVRSRREGSWAARRRQAWRSLGAWHALCTVAQACCRYKSGATVTPGAGAELPCGMAENPPSAFHFAHGHQTGGCARGAHGPSPLAAAYRPMAGADTPPGLVARGPVYVQRLTGSRRCSCWHRGAAIMLRHRRRRPWSFRCRPWHRPRS